MNITDFSHTHPVFKPEEFLTGRLQGWGIIEPTIGKPVRRVTVDASGAWDANRRVLRLDETWRFDDGHVDRLRWRIRRDVGEQYAGHEDRLKGEAQGVQAGAAFHWRYTRDVPQKNGNSVTLDFDDWFWRIDECTVMIKGTAGRFGLPFATAHLTYRKTSDQPLETD
jgi:hypothetical protein